MDRKKSFSSSIDEASYISDYRGASGSSVVLNDYYQGPFQLLYKLNIAEPYRENFPETPEKAWYYTMPCLLIDPRTGKVIPGSELDRAVELGFEASHFVGVDKDPQVYLYNKKLTNAGINIYQGNLLTHLEYVLEETSLPEGSLVNIDQTCGYINNQNGNTALKRAIKILKKLKENNGSQQPSSNDNDVLKAREEQIEVL